MTNAMKNGYWILCALLVTVSLTACEQAQSFLSVSKQHQADSSGKAAETVAHPDQSAAVSDEEGLDAEVAPGEVVAAFLDSLKSGDERQAAMLLTDKARRETEKENLIVQPPGTPSATYTVGSIEYVSDKKESAHVSSIWTENDAEGATQTFEIIWILRHQKNGWRISGMTTSVPPDQSPVLLDFENPKEMLNKWVEGSDSVEQGDPAVREAARPDRGTEGALQN